MNALQITTAEEIHWSPESLKLLEKANLQREDLEEALLNLPTIKKIQLKFPDKNERFYVEGFTDRGKKITLVIFIVKKKIQISYIKNWK